MRKKDLNLMSRSQLRLLALPMAVVLLSLNPALAENSSALNTSTEVSADIQKMVKGVVKDEAGQPVVGATVVVKGTTTGAITLNDGSFSLKASDSAVLEVMFFGYETAEVTVGKQTNLTIVLAEDALSVDEVVVVGYGSVKKKDLTGSISSLNNESLTVQKKVDVGQALQGQIAGVDVRMSSAKPGSTPYIRIRGNTSIKNNVVSRDGNSDNPDVDLSRPLYVIDGIFMDNMNTINPADIEQMDVLKDASATAIYGSRGANGVVIITTKSGSEGRTVVSYDGTIGINYASNVPEFMDGDTYVQYVTDDLRGDQWIKNVKAGNGNAETWNNTVVNTASEFRAEGEMDRVANRDYYDWQHAFINPSIQTTHNIGFTGGSNGTVYNASIGYLKDQGVVGQKEEYDRYTANIGVSKKIGDMLTVGLKNYFTFSDQEKGSPELFRSTLRLAPTVSPWGADGELLIAPDAQDTRFINPWFEEDNITNVTRTYNYNASMYVDLKPLKWLNFRSTFNPELRGSRYGQYVGMLSKSAQNNEVKTKASYNTSFNHAYTWDNVINFDTKTFKDHTLKATLIQSMYNKQYEGSSLQGTGFGTDLYSFYNMGTADIIKKYDTWYKKVSMASFAGRLNYDMYGKYLLTVTGRYDGSSMLAEGNKWSFFPSAALAWRISEENFMQNLDWFNNAKLRLSWGKVGNVNGVNPYDSQSLLSSTSYMTDPAYCITDLANPNLGWEVSEEYNVGLDLGFINNRIRFTADWYNKTTTGAIFNKTLLGLTGLGTSVGNYGSVLNRGFELSLNTTNIQTSNFTWTTNINFAKNHNEILELEGDIDKLSVTTHNYLIVGEPITALYDYEVEGIWQMDEYEDAAVYGRYPGQYRFKDQNEDGKINTDDKVVIGSNEPKWTGAITNNFTFKNFGLNFMVYTRQGVYGHSEIYQNFMPWNTDDSKFNKLAVEYWTPNNPDCDVVMPNVGSPGEYCYTDMSFVKVGNIGFNYSFGPKVLESLNLSKLTLSVDAQNPFTFSDYYGTDPETALQNSYNMSYLRSTILFGVSVQF